ncbi:hypothetical protein IEQ34_017082 [Dendrobium chrysotoxum]|uniref:RRM domain-containing protein n=1 Tax=Dendrobium chrysotoxum TaxID=161865 RepID=A0AAV7GAN8_DENCH|nr:hypothetical protein IEQ34_017082 [Dendrobium chrysotoxum]
MTPNLASQFGDTTYTKVFVGGLAWETHKETMKKYFEQFGDILEAVVITDKNTGRSKGYGFVTFREAEAAMRACVDPSPVIDGRRANCNLASLGVQRTRPPTPQHGGSRSFRVMKSYQGGVQAGAWQQLSLLLSPSLIMPSIRAYYNVYGGGAGHQYPLYGGNSTTTGNGMVTGTNAFYPYFQFGHGHTGYGLQYPQLFQYSEMSSTAGITGFAAQHYGVSPVSLAPSTPAQVAGLTMSLMTTPSLPTQAANNHYRFIPSQFPTTTIREQPLA